MQYLEMAAQLPRSALDLVSTDPMEVLPADEICEAGQIGEKGPSRNAELR
jgi:hypothetical protein